jgi:UDP-glucose 4-epimerase
MYAAAVPKFISACISGTPITIYGDGTQTRDFIFIDDVIKINILAAESRKASGMVFNAANGLRISINQLVKMIMKLTGNDVSLVYAKPRSGDVRHSVADISQAKKFLGYRQEFTLNKGLKRTIKHLTGYSSPRHGL